MRLDVDGVAIESRTFEVRADPASSITLTQHKAREAFTSDVMELQTKVEALATDLRKRREALGTATGEEVTRLQTIEQRLIGAAGRGGGRGGPQPVRQRLNGLITAFVGSGARTGTLSAPTETMRTTLAETKADLAAIEKEMK